jgi:dTDP-4-dehydrorhamnose reductase
MKRPELKIMIVGRNGQVAWELREALASLGSVSCVGRPEFDLTDTEGLRNGVRELRPDVLVNAAAYTAVDQAESEPTAAMKANAEAPAVLAEEAKELGALFVSYSSDYVFDGEKKSPYTECDVPNPINVYGATKLAGDRAVEAVGGAYLIFRTSWVYGSRGKNFLNTIMKLAAEREELRIVDDQIGAPTWSREIARATTEVIKQLTAETPMHGSERVSEVLGARRGIYNMTANGSVSWFGFATAIVEELSKKRKRQGGLAKVVPIPASQYPTLARRPQNSKLSNDKLKTVFGVSLPCWQESTVNVVGELCRLSTAVEPSSSASPTGTTPAAGA